MYAEVIPKCRLPQEADFFDYEVPSELKPVIKPGFLVNVDLRGKNVVGLVYRLKNDTAFKNIRPIKSTVLPFPPFSESDMNVLRFISDHYLISKSAALNALMPETPRRSASFRHSDTTAASFIYRPGGFPLTELRQEPALCVYSDRAVLLSSIKDHVESLSEDSQVLILEPQISSMLTTYTFLSEYYPSNVAMVHSALSKTEYWTNWLSFVEGRKRILIVTRAGILTPAKKLASIFVNDEEMADYKQYDQNPRYDARRIAFEIYKNKKINLIFATKAPRLITWHNFKQNSWPIFASRQPSPATDVVDIEDERRKFNFSLFSHTLENSVREALQKGQKVLLFFNRRGYATSVTCRDCGYTATCPDCQLPYIAHKNRLICHHCARTAEMLLHCPECHGAEIKMIGAGTEKLEKEIKNLFSKYRILRLDRDVISEDKIRLADYDIIFGTNLILKDYETQLTADLGVGVIGVVNADNLFNIPDYRSTERAWQELRKIACLADILGTRLIIQTKRPNNKVLTDIGDMDNFFSDELEARKKFCYPPFRKLVKLIAQNQDQLVAAKMIEETSLLLKKLGVDKGIEMMGPYRSSPEKIRNQFRFLITLKIDPIENINFLNQLPNGIIIDVDPEYILT